MMDGVIVHSTKLYVFCCNCTVFCLYCIVAYTVVLYNLYCIVAGEVGFLHEQRRTNVAVTRARRHLALIGDSSTISKERFINGLINFVYEHGEVRSAFDYINGEFACVVCVCR